MQVLDLSHNDLRNFFVVLPALRELHLSGNKFLQLPPGWLFPNLRTLTVQVRTGGVPRLPQSPCSPPVTPLALQLNTLSMLSASELQSYRRLQSLQAGHNKFVCSCQFVDFFQSGMKGGGGVHLTDGEQSYVCDSPLHLQGEPVYKVRLSVVECHRVEFVSASCAVALVISTAACVLLWRLHAFWYLKMTWAWLKAKRTSRDRRRRRDNEASQGLLSFDAFVSYSERDASWVENFLVPALEEPRYV